VQVGTRPICDGLNASVPSHVLVLFGKINLLV